jgi:hypothetical protein
VLAGLICSADLPLAERLLRAAIHESGHCVTALRYRLPLKEAWVNDDGTGRTRFSRSCLTPQTIEEWFKMSFAGRAAEEDLYMDYRGGDGIDQHRRADALQRLGLDWDACRVGMLKFEAEVLVGHLRPRIQRVAAALVEHRHLSADQIAQHAMVS